MQLYLRSPHAFMTWAGTPLPLVLSFPSSLLRLFRAALIPACALKFPSNLVLSIIVSSMLEMSWPCNILRRYNPYFRYTCYFYSILNVWLRIWNLSVMVLRLTPYLCLFRMVAWWWLALYFPCFSSVPVKCWFPS